MEQKPGHLAWFLFLLAEIAPSMRIDRIVSLCYLVIDSVLIGLFWGGVYLFWYIPKEIQFAKENCDVFEFV